MAVYAHAVPGATRRAAERLGSLIRTARKATDAAPEGASVAGQCTR